MQLDLATLLAQWATGGLFFCWVTTRRREVGNGLRQREAVVLRYYADLSEADIAATMGISRGAVKSHTARAMSSLKAALEQDA